MKTVTPHKVSDFEKFAKEGQRNAKLEKKIPYFLAQLAGATTRKRVEALCKEQLAWLRSPEGGGYSARSIPNRVSKYKKSIQACFKVYRIPEALRVPVKTKHHGIIDVHIAQQLFQASADESQLSVDANKKKTDADQDNSQPFSLDDALKTTEKAIQDKDWRVAAAALIFACQCRPCDLVAAGEFKAVSRYKVKATTSLKKKGNTTTQDIFTLVEAHLFIDAFNRIRREAALIALRGLSNSEIDSRVNSSINRQVVEVYGAIIPKPFTEKKLSAHNLRAAGATAAYHLYAQTGEKVQRFFELQLMHADKAAQANYDDYFCVDEKGEEITQKGIRKDAEEPLTAQPLSEKTSSLRLDKQLLAMVGDAGRWGEGSHADRLERIIARVRRAEDKVKRLEGQLARECEKRNRAELELKRLQKSPAAPTDSKPAAKAQPEIIEPIEDDEPTGFDWREVPNDVLNGDRRHDAYHEKLRRSVEAIQEYNAGLDDSDQFAITGSLLRQLSKVKPALVKSWMNEREAELSRYNAGYGGRQNTGKPDPRSVIKWSETAYGEYEWC